ncbi:uncharacterized protein LOC128989151 [Macrosteles quadrilineatus]|uniref:uncharacterized protein LOC128989151 n=1 Tax=Macrosteles quadrilineatus TaxID=74068 RepID=UPI0023E2AB6C|nr:uncharacterized protein LOC128989151 [Macrosteles quadrilineatus]
MAGAYKGMFPDNLKIARTIPIYKKGDPSLLRPISILPSFSKVIETIMKKQLIAYLEGNAILREAQHRFRDFTEVLKDCSVWLESVLNQWHKNILFDDVKKFSVCLFGIVGSTPFGFTTIKHMLPKIKEFISKREVQNSSILLPLLDVLRMLINHDEGLSWVLDSGAWKDVIQYFYEDNSIYSHRSEVLFIAALLSKLNKHSIHGVDILNFILEPNTSNCSIHGDDFLNFIIDPNASNCLLTLKTLPDSESHVISYSLVIECEQSEYNDHKYDVKVKHMLMVSKFLREIVDELNSMGSELPVKLRCQFARCLPATINAQDYLEFSKLLVTLACSNVTQNALSSQKTLYLVDNILFDAIKTFSCLRQYIFLMNLAVFYSGCFYKYLARCQDSFFLDLEQRIISLLTFFLWSHPLQNESSGNKIIIGGTDVIKYLDIKSCSTPTLVQCFNGAVNALEGCQRKSLHEKTKSIVFKELISCVIRVLQDPCCDRNGTFFTQLKTPLLRMITIANELVKTCSHQDILWLVEVMEKLLLATKGDVRITVSTLQLLKNIINVEFAFHIVEDLCEVNMYNLFCFLKQSLNDSLSWEVRDTILEVFQSAVQVGDRGCMPENTFTDILDKDIFRTILKLSTKDTSSYVRSSALKVLTKAVTTKNYIVRDAIEELCDVAFTMLLEDEMPEPRMAACDLLSAMYHADLLNSVCMQEKLFDTVFTCSTKELDWEVKKATLRFWQSTVVKQLSDKGVPIDSFYLHPSITPKTEDGVSKIIEVMDVLSSIGCLKVIWSDLVDDSEITVSEAASEVINGFINLDKKWGYIDKLLNDVNTEVPKELRPDNKFYPKEEFFQNISDDSWRERLAGRKHWVAESGDDFSSLMDHILNINSSGEFDRNAVDCY